MIEKYYALCEDCNCRLYSFKDAVKHRVDNPEHYSFQILEKP